MDATLEKIRQFSDDDYSNENRLNARIQIYEFCEKKLNWREWLFDKLDFTNVKDVLELGCGNGLLWKDNINKIPGNLHIVLTDVSQGMVDSARQNLNEHKNQFEFKAMDACQTSFQNSSFQMIIASHMLYHIENKMKIFSGIDRLLTNNCYAYASTISTSNFKDLINLAGEYDKELEFENVQTVSSFNMENGEKVLSGHFNVSNIFIYQNDVVVKNAEPLLLYLASCYSSEQLDMLIKKYNDFKNYLESSLKKNGAIRLSNKNVLYKFKKKR
jgi:ubiquinone/menaquinone biosynthesis C-methylase UbiE